MKWLDTTTNPPRSTKGGSYLLAYDPTLDTVKAFYIQKKYYTLNGSPFEPTHWMPLPYAPKKTRKAKAPRAAKKTAKKVVKKTVKKAVKKSAKKTASKKKK